MDRSELGAAVETVNCSIKFFLLFILGLLLSFSAILLQRRQLCLTLEGGDPASLPSPYPLQHAAGGITLGGLVYFFLLAQQTYRDTQKGGNSSSERLAWWNLLASALVLLAAVIRLWTLEQGRTADSLIQLENEELPV